MYFLNLETIDELEQTAIAGATAGSGQQ